MPILTAGRAKRTEILRGIEDVVDAEARFFCSTKRGIDTCMNYTRPPLGIGIGQIKKAFLDAKSRGVRLRYLTEITNDNISYCKELIKIVDQLPHLDAIKGGIAVNETEYMATTVLQEAKPLTQVIYSNVKEVVDQGQYIFDTFWYRATSAEQKIREIEEGIEPSRIEVIPDTKVSIRSLDLIKSAVKEVLVIFATSKTFSVAMNMGVSQLYREVIHNGAKIRLLIPDSQESQRILNELKSVVPQVEVRIADKSLQTRITILVVDTTELMIPRLLKKIKIII